MNRCLNKKLLLDFFLNGRHILYFLLFVVIVLIIYPSTSYSIGVRESSDNRKFLQKHSEVQRQLGEDVIKVGNFKLKLLGKNLGYDWQISELQSAMIKVEEFNKNWKNFRHGADQKILEQQQWIIKGESAFRTFANYFKVDTEDVQSLSKFLIFLEMIAIKEMKTECPEG